nr:hypothetical protein [Tanacetum cinerariifolium]
MERDFLSQKGSGGGRRVKEKDLNRNKKNTSSDICVFTNSDDTMNDDTPIGVAFTVQEGVTPCVVDMTVETKKQNSLEDTNVLGSFPSLSTPGTTPTGNAPGKSSYANITGKPSGKKVNVRTLFTPGGNGIDLVVPVDSIRAISERFANTAYGSSYVGVMIELRADVELKDNIVVAMPKITKEGHYTCNNTCAGEKKTVKKPSQTSRGVSVGPKMGFKPQKEYRPVLKNPNASSSGNKKKGVELTIENPLFPTGIMESDSEVEVVFDETANLRISKSGKDGSDKGYGTNSLLKQWRGSYPDNDDYDLYDDDMYENHDLSEHLQSICDDLDITVRGRKKK